MTQFTRVNIYNFGCFTTKFGKFTLQRNKAYVRLQLVTGVSLILHQDVFN